MPFAITQSCCTDASCLSVCPVNCIHPTPGEPEFGTTELLHVDPRSCIDCGACADACPVDAIMSIRALPPEQAHYAAINAAYFTDRPAAPAWDAPVFPPTDLRDVGRLDVAIVGTGPAACYAAQALQRVADPRITFYERAREPGGLARFGVAPDHTDTRRIFHHFEPLFTHPRVTVRYGVDVGVDVTAAELDARHDAVLYAVGAQADRTPGIPGEELAGSMPARTAVGWYNGHPDVDPARVDLAGVRRAVVVGNGNVALDVARILTADPETLAATPLAPAALAALRAHRVQEVVVLGRRGAADAAFTSTEVVALRHVPGVELVLTGAVGADLPDALAGLRHVELTEEPGPGRRIVLAFGTRPLEVTGTGRVDGVVLGTPGGPVHVGAQLVLHATGFRGRALPGLSFDEATATVPHHEGRVLGADGRAVPGRYVVGWIKRGATGGIGANKTDAEETVRSVVADAAAAGRARRGAGQDGARAPRRSRTTA